MTLVKHRQGPGTERARLIAAAQMGTAVWCAVLLVGSVIVKFRPPLIAVHSLVILSMLIGRLLLRNGRVETAAVSLAVTVFSGVTASAAVLGTVRAPATVYYLIVVMLARVLFRGRGLMIAVGGSVTALAGLVAGERLELLPVPEPFVGPVQWITISGAVFLAAIMIHAAFVRMESAQNRLSEALEFLPLPVLVSDRRTFFVCNRAFTAAFGYSIGDFSDIARWIERAMPDERSGLRTMAWWSRQFKHPDSPVLRPVRMRCKDGSIRIVEITARPADEIIIGAFSDVTERVRNLAEREALEARMHQVDKLESLGTLAGGIAHDFNNLLGGIYGYTELARAHASSGTAAEYLDKAVSTMDRARRLTGQLLTFSRGGAPERQRGSVEQTLKEASALAAAGSNTALDFNMTPGLDQCEFDRGQISQLIENLVINACQAMPGGGRIEVTAVNVELGLRNPHGLPAGRYVCIAFRDFGQGIAASDLRRIFDPFFSTRPSGRGLGLSTAYSIARRHGGSISVESEPGKGATFRLFLPSAR